MGQPSQIKANPGTDYTQAAYPPAMLAWTVWGLGALLYLIGFYQRVAPAVITDRLMADFTLGAAALGNLSAFYFYSYVVMQIPTGIIADRWGRAACSPLAPALQHSVRHCLPLPRPFSGPMPVAC